LKGKFIKKKGPKLLDNWKGSDNKRRGGGGKGRLRDLKTIDVTGGGRVPIPQKKVLRTVQTKNNHSTQGGFVRKASIAVGRNAKNGEMVKKKKQKKKNELAEVRVKTEPAGVLVVKVS